MRIRAAAILIEDHQLAVMERFRDGRHYFTFPGGGKDDHETPEQAVTREIEEELGIRVRIIRLIAEVHYLGSKQFFYLVERTEGVFGTGTGEEYSSEPSPHGTYHPMWMNIAELLDHPLYPTEIAELVIRAQKDGWAHAVVIIDEPDQ